jgi:hypothetical protein
VLICKCRSPTAGIHKGSEGGEDIAVLPSERLHIKWCDSPSSKKVPCLELGLLPDVTLSDGLKCEEIGGAGCSGEIDAGGEWDLSFGGGYVYVEMEERIWSWGAGEMNGGAVIGKSGASGLSNGITEEWCGLKLEGGSENQWSKGQMGYVKTTYPSMLVLADPWCAILEGVLKKPDGALMIKGWNDLYDIVRTCLRWKVVNVQYSTASLHKLRNR